MTRWARRCRAVGADDRGRHDDGADGGGPRIVAHRGLHARFGRGPRENTCEAFVAALDAGVPWVETDVRLTRDGVPVLLHDLTLRRLWGDRRAIADLDLAEVQRLGGVGMRIPTLAEALGSLDGRGATVLIDMSSALPAHAAVEVVLSCRADTRTAWCGDLEGLREVRSELPGAMVWMPWSRRGAPRESDVTDLHPTTINVRHRLVEPGFVAAVHALGLEVAVWTVNRGRRAASLIGSGVDSVTTNRVPRVRRVLER